MKAYEEQNIWRCTIRTENCQCLIYNQIVDWLFESNTAPLQLLDSFYSLNKAQVILLEVKVILFVYLKKEIQKKKLHSDVKYQGTIQE